MTSFSTSLELTEEQQDRLRAFARMVVEENLVQNLTAHADFETMWARHIEDSLAAVPQLRQLSAQSVRPSLIDIGSGAGFPGLVLAAALPDWQIVSLEATQKKVRFQERVINKLGLKNARVISDRAETLAHHPKHREQYGAATARALAALPVLAELALPFVCPGGAAFAWKGPRASEEINQSQTACSKLGATIQPAIPYHLDMPGEELPEFYLVVMGKEQNTPLAYPRQMSAIKKKPLG